MGVEHWGVEEEEEHWGMALVEEGSGHDTMRLHLVHYYQLAVFVRQRFLKVQPPMVNVQAHPH